MKKNELIAKCKYYNGEEICPDNTNNNKRMLWNTERVWVNEESKEESSMLMDMCDDYRAVGLLDWNNTDGVPLTLKAMLLNRYAKYYSGSLQECVPHFKIFYITYYH